MIQQQIEHVARAFYEAEGFAVNWESAPELVKDKFRLYASEAVALLDHLRRQNPMGDFCSALAGVSKDRIDPSLTSYVM